MFRARALVLNIQKIRDQQVRIILFSYEFGKIHCWIKKDPWVDIGNLVSVVLERKWNENHTKSIEVTASIEDYLKTYDEVTSYLYFIQKLNKILPEWVEQKNIYTDIERIFSILSTKKPWVWIIQLIILLNIRILKMLWYLDKSLFIHSSVLLYIFEYIDLRSIDALYNGKNLDDPLLEELRTILEKTYHTLIHST